MCQHFVILLSGQPLRNIQVGDVVIIQNGKMPPTKWPLGHVLGTHPGIDGHVCVIKLLQM